MIGITVLFFIFTLSLVWLLGGGLEYIKEYQNIKNDL
jgi:hypothetical protein